MFFLSQLYIYELVYVGGLIFLNTKNVLNIEHVTKAIVNAEINTCLEHAHFFAYFKSICFSWILSFLLLTNFKELVLPVHIVLVH